MSALSRSERAAFLRSIAEEIDELGRRDHRDRHRRDRAAAGAARGERGRTTGQLRLFADHIEKADYLDRRHDVASARPAAVAAPGHQTDPAADRPGRRVRRLELPARLLDGRRRHRLGARRRLPGGGQGPFGASRHRRDWLPRRSTRRSHASAACTRACSR